MRILQICSARSVGGGERHLADLANELARRGHRVFAALAPDSPIQKELVNVPPENILFAPVRNAFDIAGAVRLVRFVRAHKIEIIHAHLGRDYVLAAVAARLTGAPFVLTRHVLFPLKIVNKFFLRRAKRVVAVSNAVAESLANTFPPEKIATIHNGINLERFSAGIPKSKTAFTVGTIGHLAPIKGQTDFIRAAAIIAAQRQNVNFVIVGEDKSRGGKNRIEIENLIAESNLQNRVRLVGWLDDVRDALAQFDLFVSAARAEPFGLVIVEAMAAGVPVIATKSEGALEIVENDDSGKLVEIGDVNGLAATILNLLDDPSARERLAENARARVYERFSLRKMVEQTEAVYRRVLAER